MARSNAKDPSIKEWAILRLKKGYTPKQIAIDIQKLHGVYVAMMTVYRWRENYILDTGEYIPLTRLTKKQEEQKKRTQK
jgi:IS30 family transposase